ncbi:glycosyl transferase family protein [Bordetella ansorpii]|uniref:Glycosyl transferase family protein n=1 Tax=Bordetella ansorpii TaxID=288768 RepID=A0A157R1H7_9BORD|nr:glycosyltransferase family 2 protein [Bordetella ansorpii]SAI51808.1 glycosyl transferase family protein [Bordetella ansorpii]
MNAIDFSVVMPAYNSAATLADSIDSVLAQTHGNFELIVVDDCSRDETPRILAEYCRRDARIVAIRQPQNGGVALARNAAIEAARGRYLAFLDSDDLWLPRKLEVQARYFAEGHAVLHASYIRFGHGREQVVQARSTATFRDLLHGNFIGNLTGAYDVEKVGKIYQDRIAHEDYKMWLDVLRAAGSITGIPEVLGRYRVAAQSLSGNKLKSAIWTWRLYRRHLHLGVFEAATCFVSYAWRATRKRM